MSNQLALLERVVKHCVKSASDTRGELANALKFGGYEVGGFTVDEVLAGICDDENANWTELVWSFNECLLGKVLVLHEVAASPNEVINAFVGIVVVSNGLSRGFRAGGDLELSKVLYTLGWLSESLDSELLVPLIQLLSNSLDVKG
jgi:hypothetical protein